MGKIRDANERDLPLLKSLWLEFMEYHRHLGEKYRFFPTEWPTVKERFRRSLSAPDFVLKVAEFENALVGYTYGYIYHNFPGYFPRVIGFVQDFYVTGSMRKKGLGRELWRDVEQWFGDRGIEVVQLQVAFANQNALGFWKHMGLEEYSIGMWKQINSR